MSFIHTISNLIPKNKQNINTSNYTDIQNKQIQRKFILFNNYLLDDIKIHYIAKTKIIEYKNNIIKTLELYLNNNCIEYILNFIFYDELIIKLEIINNISFPISLNMIYYLLYNRHFLESDEKVNKLKNEVEYYKFRCTHYPDSIRQKFTNLKFIIYAVKLINDIINDNLKKEPIILYINDYINLLSN